MKFKFGVDSFIWAEDFKEKDLWIIEKAKEIGFEVVDFAIANPYTFPTEQVKAELARVGMDCVCTTTLTLETNPISPDEEIRKAAVAAMKKCVDITAIHWEHPIASGSKLCWMGIPYKEAKN